MNSFSSARLRRASDPDQRRTDRAGSVARRAGRRAARIVSLAAIGSVALASLPATPGARAMDRPSGLAPRVNAAAVIELVVTGRDGVPASGVGAVALNVTATNASAPSFLTVWPTGAPMPVASNLNFTTGQTIPNMVIAKVGDNGQISVFNSQGTTDVIVDVLGWFPDDGSFTGLTPARLLDTRGSSAPPTTPPSTPPTEPPTTPPPTDPAPIVYAPGTWMDLPAGRYVMEQADADCYWERWGDVGGAWIELSGSYQFYAGRTVVDILGYENLTFTQQCGIMTPLPATWTPSATIPRGTHVVNLHIQPGTYRILIDQAAVGCGWARLSDFTNGASYIDALSYGDPGEEFVTIEPTDAGFQSDCGLWTKVA